MFTLGYGSEFGKKNRHRGWKLETGNGEIKVEERNRQLEVPEEIVERLLHYPLRNDPCVYGID